MEFKKRTTAPNITNIWYGAKNKFSLGNNSMFIKRKNSKGVAKYGNCTHYAYGRLMECQNKVLAVINGNADDWYSNAPKKGYKVGKTPKLGAIIVYKHTTKSGGHVANVEEIYSNGDLLLSMSGYKSFLFTTRKVKKSDNYCYNDYKLLGFIYPEAKFEEAADDKRPYNEALPKLPSRGYFKTGDKGEEAKKLQKFLNWAIGAKLSVDGIIGSKTITAIKKFQKEVKISQDGLFGKNCLSKAKTFIK